MRTVLVGRSAARLDAAATGTGAAATLTAEGPTDMAAAITDLHESAHRHGRTLVTGAGTPIELLGLDLVEAAGGEVFLP